jgi:hypothetical protein
MGRGVGKGGEREREKREERRGEERRGEERRGEERSLARKTWRGRGEMEKGVKERRGKE